MVDRVLIIAEAGVNHNGNISIAKEMIDVAAEAGADFVKFQTFRTENLVSKHAKKAAYQQKNMKTENDSQLLMLKKLELSHDNHIELIEHCRKRKISFLSAPFDMESIDLLEELDIPLWKIPSGEITNYPYLIKLAKTKKPVILSTGMSTIEEIEETIGLLRSFGTKDITLLHCNTQYPTPFCDVNLRVLSALRNRFHIGVGYSDHTIGIEVPIAAVAMGATVIEKHFTLDKNMEGPDHKASLEPLELKKMIMAIRNIELALGTEEKRPTNSEYENINIARKSIVARCQIKEGEIFSESNITTKRPGGGISPMEWPNIIGKRASQNFNEDEMIK